MRSAPPGVPAPRTRPPGQRERTRGVWFAEEAGHTGRRNYLIDGRSGTGKTTVCDELRRRGFHAIHGDRELRVEAETREDLPTELHLSPRWDTTKVAALVTDRTHAVTFLCGGCRNSAEFVDLLDGVFVLEVDLATAMRRIDERVAVDPSDWGGRQEERDIIMRLHQTQEGLPEGWAVDATAAVEHVVDDILRRVDPQAGPYR